MLVYGKNVAEELLKKNYKVKKIYLQDNFSDKLINSLLENTKIPIILKTKLQMNDLVNGLHQGIILDIDDYKCIELDEILKSNPNFIVILDHLEDPHNLGAIIRTSEAASVDAIIIPKDRQVGINSTVMKTSAGALINMKICSVTNLVSTINKLKENGFWIIGTDLENSVDYKNIDYSGKIALVIGNEGKGMSKLVKKQCDFIANIPIYGTVNSLNASVASGIMIYEVVRNRK